MKFDELDDKMRVYETAFDLCALPGMFLVARSAIESLQTIPLRCGLARENAFFIEEIRQPLCGKYRILFESARGLANPQP